METHLCFTGHNVARSHDRAWKGETDARATPCALHTNEWKKRACPSCSLSKCHFYLATNCNESLRPPSAQVKKCDRNITLLFSSNQLLSRLLLPFPQFYNRHVIFAEEMTLLSLLPSCIVGVNGLVKIKRLSIKGWGAIKACGFCSKTQTFHMKSAQVDKTSPANHASCLSWLKKKKEKSSATLKLCPDWGHPGPFSGPFLLFFVNEGKIDFVCLFIVV